MSPGGSVNFRAPRGISISTAILTVAFIAAAASSNWAIENIGRYNGPSAPHTIPVGWGLEAPSGVVLIGIMIAIRDSLHERVGFRGTLLAIAAASAVSGLLSPASVAVASGVTLLVAETTDGLVYRQLRRRGRYRAAVASNLVSAVVDSLMFLAIAYGVTAAWEGAGALTIAKVGASFVTLTTLAVVARAARSLRTCSATS